MLQKAHLTMAHKLFGFMLWLSTRLHSKFGVDCWPLGCDLIRWNTENPTRWLDDELLQPLLLLSLDNWTAVDGDHLINIMPSKYHHNAQVIFHFYDIQQGIQAKQTRDLSQQRVFMCHSFQFGTIGSMTNAGGWCPCNPTVSSYIITFTLEWSRVDTMRLIRFNAIRLEFRKTKTATGLPMPLSKSHTLAVRIEWRRHKWQNLALIQINLSI